MNYTITSASCKTLMTLCLEMLEESQHRHLLEAESHAISRDTETKSQRTASTMQIQVKRVEVMKTN